MKTIILLSVFILTFAKGQVPGTQDMSFGTNGKTEYLYDPASVKGFHGYTMNILPDNRFLSAEYQIGAAVPINTILAFSQNLPPTEFQILHSDKMEPTETLE
ncbi:hypothetical protein [uncultured Chryseobacterium sp.]|uniref:hypothetical protein n=1 Tax=uncultured Chryseobacterium sp. TaxID=259322 RepID=UPI0025EDA5E3|nr:hypothetical protein [uncultured Chryseobacterium sp.]